MIRIVQSLRAPTSLNVLSSLTWAPTHTLPMGPRTLFKLTLGPLVSVLVAAGVVVFRALLLLLCLAVSPTDSNTGWLMSWLDLRPAPSAWLQSSAPSCSPAGLAGRALAVRPCPVAPSRGPLLPRELLDPYSALPGISRKSVCVCFWVRKQTIGRVRLRGTLFFQQEINGTSLKKLH